MFGEKGRKASSSESIKKISSTRGKMWKNSLALVHL
jgi:hypothetical protein